MIDCQNKLLDHFKLFRTLKKEKEKKKWKRYSKLPVLKMSKFQISSHFVRLNLRNPGLGNANYEWTKKKISYHENRGWTFVSIHPDKFSKKLVKRKTCQNKVFYPWIENEDKTWF